MAVIPNMLNTVNYWLSRHSEPIMTNPTMMISDLSVLTKEDTDSFDPNNYEKFVGGPDKNGVFTAERVGNDQTQIWYQQWLKQCEAWGSNPQIKHMWTYKSEACHSNDKFRLDIYNPGRIVMKTSLPKYGCASGWLYYSENTGDFGKEWILPIDRAEKPREVYFEIDIFETFTHWLGQRVSMSGHYGTQTNRSMISQSITGKFPDKHYLEVRWDGKGNWTWYVDNVQIYTAKMPDPPTNVGKIYPHLKLTYMVMEEFPANVNSSSWQVDYIKIGGNVIDVKTWQR